MADYSNHQFECFIPEKDIEENLLLLQSFSENVRGVKIGRFYKVDYGAECTSFKPGCNQGKIAANIFRCFGKPF